jgi:3-dehydroquinate synthase
MARQAIIPAAGRGLRLDRPGTPKPLVDVGGQPMVVRLIRQLTAAGVQKIAVVLGFEGDKIRNALSRYNFQTELVWPRNPRWETGIAASVLAAKDVITERFLLAMADHVFDDTLISVVAGCPLDENEAAALIEPDLDNVFALNTAVKVRIESGLITAMSRYLDAFDAVDAGLFNLPVTIFSDLAANIEPDRENHLAMGLASVIEQGRMRAVTAKTGTYDDVDTPAALVHSEMRLRQQRRVSTVKQKTRSVPDSYTRFNYRIDLPKDTEMLVGRGFVADPSRIPLIPDHAASSPIFVFTDEVVNQYYGRDFSKRLTEMGYDVHLIVLPEGESSKSLTSYAFLVERVLSQGVDERSVFISLGGGVVCNVCGFVASTIYRGLDLVHVPTTLMSQCDAAVSHKQGINGYQGKNLVGTYYSPRMVAVDVETLATLPKRLLYDGMSEVIKHAIGQDPAYVDLLLSYSGDIRDFDFLEEVIKQNVRLKCDLVVSDSKELKEALILQYGHTVGHAVEHLTGYQLYHGESVGVGMAVAARVARIMGACDDDLVALHDTLIGKYKLPTQVPASIRADDVIASLRYSKRYLTEGTRMALLSGVGALWCVDGDCAIPVSDGVLIEAIEQCKSPK